MVKKNYACRKCGYRMPTPIVRQLHEEICTVLPKYRCSICKYATTKSFNWNRHAEAHRKARPGTRFQWTHPEPLTLPPTSTATEESTTTDQWPLLALPQTSTATAERILASSSTSKANVESTQTATWATLSFSSTPSVESTPTAQSTTLALTPTSTVTVDSGSTPITQCTFLSVPTTTAARNETKTVKEKYIIPPRTKYKCTLCKYSTTKVENRNRHALLHLKSSQPRSRKKKARCMTLCTIPAPASVVSSSELLSVVSQVDMQLTPTMATTPAAITVEDCPITAYELVSTPRQDGVASRKKKCVTPQLTPSSVKVTTGSPTPTVEISRSTTESATESEFMDFKALITQCMADALKAVAPQPIVPKPPTVITEPVVPNPVQWEPDAPQPPPLQLLRAESDVPEPQHVQSSMDPTKGTSPQTGATQQPGTTPHPATTPQPDTIPSSVPDPDAPQLNMETVGLINSVDQWISKREDGITVVHTEWYRTIVPRRPMDPSVFGRRRFVRSLTRPYNKNLSVDPFEEILVAEANDIADGRL